MKGDGVWLNGSGKSKEVSPETIPTRMILVDFVVTDRQPAPHVKGEQVRK